MIIDFPKRKRIENISTVFRGIIRECRCIFDQAKSTFHVFPCYWYNKSLTTYNYFLCSIAALHVIQCIYNK